MSEKDVSKQKTGAKTSQREQQQSSKTQKDPWRAPKVFFASGLAGAVSRTATAPIERLRMLLIVEQGRPLTLYEGLKKMAKEGSIGAYFKGNTANVIKIVPETAIKLTAADMIKNRIVQDPNRIQMHERFISGALGGALSQFTIYPLEVIRTRLTTCQEKHNKGIWRTGLNLVQKEGFRGIYRGISPAMIGIIPYAGVDIMCFGMIEESLLETYYPTKPPDMLIIAAGMFSSGLAQVVSFPFNMLRTRLQAQKPEPYDNMWEAFTKTVQKDGYRGLYKGLLPGMMKLVPAQGISWYVYYKARVLLGICDVRKRSPSPSPQPQPTPTKQQQQKPQQHTPSTAADKQQQQQLLQEYGMSWGNFFMVGVMLAPIITYAVLRNYRRIQYKRQLQQCKVMGT